MQFNDMLKILKKNEYAVLPYETEINVVCVFIKKKSNELPKTVVLGNCEKRIIYVSSDSHIIDEKWVKKILQNRIFNKQHYVVDAQNAAEFRLYYDLLYLSTNGYKYKREIDYLKKTYNVKESELVEILFQNLLRDNIKVVYNWKFTRYINKENLKKLKKGNYIWIYDMYRKLRYGRFFVLSRIRKKYIGLRKLVNKKKSEKILTQDVDLKILRQKKIAGCYSGCLFFEGNYLDKRVFVKGFEPCGFQSIKNEKKASKLLSDSIYPTYFYYDYSKDDLYVIFPFETNCTLGEYIRENKLTVKMINQLMRQFIDILDAMYEKGIIHRDIKDDNIVINVENDDSIQVKVIDFGWALFKNEKGEILNKENLMSNAFEVVLGGKCRASDFIWDDAASMILLIEDICEKSNININMIHSMVEYSEIAERVGRITYHR